jgi:hypothetical protein
VKGCITSRKMDKDGNPVLLANANTILDTHEYMFTFDDGDETILNANLIAEAMYAQCDSDGNQCVLLDSIIDHRQLDTAIRPSDQKIARPDRRTYMKCSTIDW